MVEKERKSRGRRGGSVFFRAARGVWVAEVKRPDGRTVTKTAKPKPAAERLLVELQADNLGGVRSIEWAQVFGLAEDAPALTRAGTTLSHKGRVGYQR